MARTKFTPLRPNLLHRPDIISVPKGRRSSAWTQADEEERVRIYHESIALKTREFKQRRQESWKRLRLWRQHQDDNLVDIRCVNVDDSVETAEEKEFSDTSSTVQDETDGNHEVETASVRSSYEHEIIDIVGDSDEDGDQDDECSDTTMDSVHYTDMADDEISNLSEHAGEEEEFYSEDRDENATSLNCDLNERSTRDSETDALLSRFGTTNYYEDVFRNINYYDATEIFRIMEATKSNKMDERYEAARQEFLKIYGKHSGIWLSTSHATDEYVDVSKIHIEGKEEYLAFMRIKPNGFRGERYVPAYMDMKLHLLIGKVLLTYKKRQRTMTCGSHVHIAPKSTVSIRCIRPDQAAVFVFKITIDKNRRKEAVSSQSP